MVAYWIDRGILCFYGPWRPNELAASLWSLSGLYLTTQDLGLPELCKEVMKLVAVVALRCGETEIDLSWDDMMSLYGRSKPGSGIRKVCLETFIWCSMAKHTRARDLETHMENSGAGEQHEFTTALASRSLEELRHVAQRPKPPWVGFNIGTFPLDLAIRGPRSRYCAE